MIFKLLLLFITCFGRKLLFWERFRSAWGQSAAFLHFALQRYIGVSFNSRWKIAASAIALLAGGTPSLKPVNILYQQFILRKPHFESGVSSHLE
jgi:hypothetical protein